MSIIQPCDFIRHRPFAWVSYKDSLLEARLRSWFCSRHPSSSLRAPGSQSGLRRAWTCMPWRAHFWNVHWRGSFHIHAAQLHPMGKQGLAMSKLKKWLSYNQNQITRVNRLDTPAQGEKTINLLNKLNMWNVMLFFLLHMLHNVTHILLIINFHHIHLISQCCADLSPGCSGVNPIPALSAPRSNSSRAIWKCSFWDASTDVFQAPKRLRSTQRNLYPQYPQYPQYCRSRSSTSTCSCSSLQY